MAISSTEEYDDPFDAPSFPEIEISEEAFSQFQREGYYSGLVPLSSDYGLETVKVYIFNQKRKKFIDARPCIEKCLNKRPGSKVRKSLRTKGKK